MAALYLMILTALEFEARPIARALGLRFAARTYAIGSVNDVDVRLYIVGPGAACLPIADHVGRCGAVILAGLAGGLSPDLRRGDVIVDEASDLPIDVPHPRVRVESRPSLTTTPEAKADIRTMTGGGVVDMESVVVRAWARGRQIPFVGIRVVSDTSTEALDPATLRIVDREGFLKPIRLLSEVVRRPALIVALWRLRAMGRIAGVLAADVRRLVGRLTSETDPRIE